MGIAYIRHITPTEARPIRHQVLRPGQPVETVMFPGDDDPTTVHYGAALRGELIGIVSLFHQKPDWTNEDSWMMRGMATIPDYQGKGYGEALVQRCIEHAKHKGGKILWFNARTSAVDFYKKLGFETRGEVFDVEGGGPHIVMWKQLD